MATWGSLEAWAEGSGLRSFYTGEGVVETNLGCFLPQLPLQPYFLPVFPQDL